MLCGFIKNPGLVKSCILIQPQGLKGQSNQRFFSTNSFLYIESIWPIGHNIFEFGSEYSKLFESWLPGVSDPCKPKRNPPKHNSKNLVELSYYASNGHKRLRAKYVQTNKNWLRANIINARAKNEQIFDQLICWQMTSILKSIKIYADRKKCDRIDQWKNWNLPFTVFK